MWESRQVNSYFQTRSLQVISARFDSVRARGSFKSGVQRNIEIRSLIYFLVWENICIEIFLFQKSDNVTNAL